MCPFDKSFKLRVITRIACFIVYSYFFIAMCMGGYNIKNNKSLIERLTVNIEK